MNSMVDELASQYEDTKDEAGKLIESGKDKMGAFKNEAKHTLS